MASKQRRFIYKSAQFLKETGDKTLTLEKLLRLAVKKLPKALDRSENPQADITEKIVFSRLSYDVQIEIAKQLLANELAFMSEKGLAVSCSPGVLPFLVQRGFHPRFGARPMRDAVEKHVRDAVGRACLDGSGAAIVELVVHGSALAVRAT